MSAYRDGDVPIIVRGEGCYLEDVSGKRYLDGLAGLFAVQIGYSFGEEIGEAAAAQLRELPFYTNWGYAHPRAIELAAELASLAPGDLNRVFFVSGGSEAVESAWKLARQYYAARGEQRGAVAVARAEVPTRPEEAHAVPAVSERRWKAISRQIAYHGTTMGALSINGIPALRTPFEPLVPEVIHVRNTNRYHRPPGETEDEFTELLLDDLERAIESAGPETVAMVIMEPVQNAGGAFTPPAGYFRGVRELCDRFDILLCADEVITGFGRLGAWFGSELYDIRPDLLLCAKGLSSAHAAIGAVVARDEVMEAFLDGTKMYSHGITFGGPSASSSTSQSSSMPSAPPSLSCWTCPLRETYAGRASSTPSSLSRTRKHASPSRMASARSCSAVFSHRACSSAGSSAAPTTAAIPSCRSRLRL
jgi:adenosylmethionine-8-amino-7-oxononanoate aminotransferase